MGVGEECHVWDSDSRSRLNLWLDRRCLSHCSSAVKRQAALRKGSKCRLTLSSREFVRYHHDGADRRGAGAVAERALHPDLQAAGGEILGLVRALETSTKLPLLILPSFTNWGPSIKHRSLWRHSHSNHHSY